ncbi:hypothetical protein ABZ027_38885 [Streptomyces sp. NPDC006332]|uniref:hypothetical protein n=1 Tax=Streptomyces sp. NPDC006332 TaxID=3155456 RepID=UPI0033B43EA9
MTPKVIADDADALTVGRALTDEFVPRGDRREGVRRADRSGGRERPVRSVRHPLSAQLPASAPALA